jgi:MEDS: MEthanogen/methylotroph, DcmR Sensory domain
VDAATGEVEAEDPNRAARPIRLGAAVLGPHRHICAFFNSRDDEYGALLRFIKDGFERGEKAVHIIDPRRRDQHVRRLQSVGIDADAARPSAKVRIRPVIIIGGMIQENPFFVPPVEFIRELRKRRAREARPAPSA